MIQRALFVIIPPEKGRKGRTNKNYTTIHLDTNTYFQLTTLVKNHQPKNFRDLKIFSRALCKKDGDFYVIHSNYLITLNTFAKNLTEYEYAWNLDIGSYGYGWYCDNDKLNHLVAQHTISQKEVNRLTG